MSKMNEENLRKLRLTVDMLEVRMRQQGIQKISDVQWAKWKGMNIWLS